MKEDSPIELQRPRFKKWEASDTKFYWRLVRGGAIMSAVFLALGYALTFAGLPKNQLWDVFWTLLVLLPVGPFLFILQCFVLKFVLESIYYSLNRNRMKPPDNDTVEMKLEND